ncbi:MAG: response regulator [Candidatus Saccharimonadales bacterium]
MTKILLVEDDRSLREIYGVRLLAEGYDIVSAGDGEEALAMAIKERPTLILSDVMMPKISGFDMLDILRSTTETKNVKVIMMTALSSEDQRARGEALGADRYLVKSQVGIEDVVRTVHEVLADAPGTTATQQQAQSAEPEQEEQPTAAPTPAATPAPVQTPVPVATPQPVATPAPQQQAAQTPAPQAETPAPQTPLPQPTAPFTSPRPATLGERIIQPIDTSEATKDGMSLADRIAAELKQATQPHPPTQQPTAAPTPAATPAPVQTPAPVATPAPQQQAAQTPAPQAETPAPTNNTLQQ